MRLRLLVHIFALFISVSSFASLQQSLEFSHITKEQGLSDVHVECFLKDSDGFMWFGTRNGLCRFDGYEIKIYRNTLQEGSISGNRIHSIAEDKYGYLWIATYRDGLNRLDRQTEIFKHYGTDQGVDNRVNRVCVFNDGNLWVCSNSNLGLYNYEEDTFEFFKPAVSKTNEPLSQPVYDILKTNKGDIFVALDVEELYQYLPKENRFIAIPYKSDSNLSGNYRKNLIEDSKGNIWIAAMGHGLVKYNPVTKISKTYSKDNSSLSSNMLFSSMIIDSKDNLWICTEDDGVNILNINNDTFTHLKADKNNPKSLNTDQTYSIYLDEDDMLWIGTFNQGINIYDPHETKFHSSLFSPNDLKVLEGSSVLDVFEDSKQRIWIGTDGNGLFLFEKGKNPVHFDNLKGTYSNVINDVVTALNEDYLGNILIGTYSNGLVSYNPEEDKMNYFIQKDHTNSLSSMNVWEIIHDSHNRIWLGLLAGGVDLFYPEKESFENLGPLSMNNNKINSHNIMTIYEDSEGDIWFGTEGKGLFVLDHQLKKIQRIQGDSIYQMSTHGIIKCIYQDRWGMHWFGTEDDGLFKLDRKTNTYTHFDESMGLHSQTIMSLSEDNDGYMWIGSPDGLFRYDSKTAQFKHFIISDGLTSNLFNADAMVKISDGRILAGTSNGIDIIKSDDILLNKTIPKLQFTKLLVLNNEVVPNQEVHGKVVLNQSITATKQIELSYKEKIFTIEFAALNYTLPQKCEYKYILEGFDDHWVQTSSDRRFATYSNLDAGSYNLRVIASNNDAVWGDNEISMKIKIKPPWWETLLFKYSLIGILILLVYLGYKIRLKMHKERFRQKQMENEKRIVLLENEKLEAELKKLAFHTINKNKLLLEQKNKILILSNKAKESVKQGLAKVVESIDEELDEEKDWKFIEPQIDKAYNQFISKLRTKHKDLTATEIRIAAYIRMNLTTKEISEFMNKTTRAVENDRYRLRKKIGLETNDSIQNYLLNLD